MSIGIDPIVDRLSVLKRRLESAPKEDVRQIAGVDLYHLPDPRVKQAFEERTQYYTKLSGNRSFLALEDKAKETAMRLAKIALLLGERLTPEMAKRFSDWFYPPRRTNMWENDAALKEKLQHYLKHKNYFTIRDLGKEGMLAGHPYDEGIYYNCNSILEQHWQLYKHCQGFGRASRELGSEVEQKKYSETFQELSHLIDELEFHLIQEPRKLHLGNFEEVQLAAAAFDHNVLGHVTKLFQAARGDNEDKKTEDIRKAAIDVCEMLALEIAIQPQVQVGQSDSNQDREFFEDHGLKIWTSRGEVECAGVKKALSDRNWGIVSRCLAGDSWSTGCDFLLGDGRTVDDVDGVLREVNEPWEKTGWRIIRRKGRRILLGAVEKRKSPQTTPEVPPKQPRKTPVIAK